MPPKKRAEPVSNTRAKGSSTASTTGPGKAALADPESAGARQMKAYENGIRAFREQKVSEARGFFEEAAGGPLSPVAHNARLHLSILQRRSNTLAPHLVSGEDEYNYAVELLNSGEFTKAREHLLIAQKTMPDSDHILYAMASCDALSGDVRAAYENLKRAIDINPRNRLNARQDTDFADAARNPLLQSLLYPEKSNPF